MFFFFPSTFYFSWRVYTNKAHLRDIGASHFALSLTHTHTHTNLIIEFLVLVQPGWFPRIGNWCGPDNISTNVCARVWFDKMHIYHMNNRPPLGAFVSDQLWYEDCMATRGRRDRIGRRMQSQRNMESMREKIEIYGHILKLNTDAWIKMRAKSSFWWKRGQRRNWN